MKEIGSEYWQKSKSQKINNLEYFNLGKDTQFLMSGRTAINYILENIYDTKKIVYMPNYCCESMVIPFIDNGYKIKYYEVDLINNKYNINKEEEISIFFSMSYFGYSKSNMDNHINYFSKKNIIVIEDITHRIFQKDSHCKNSTYLIASLRKWFPIYSGAIAVNTKKKFEKDISNYKINHELINIKKQAMQLKKEYMNNNITEKENYIKLFNEYNDKIKNYKNFKIDDESYEILKEININEMINRRKENTKLIEKKLNKNKKIKLLFEQKQNDCPLFVPIIIEDRNKIRKELIDNNIYCPIHWPDFNQTNNDIYKYELSLICDQRYKKNDIKEYINKLLKIVGE